VIIADCNQKDLGSDPPASGSSTALRHGGRNGSIFPSAGSPISWMESLSAAGSSRRWAYRRSSGDRSPSLTDRDRKSRGPDYFTTLGTRLLAGRDFTRSDGRDAPAVAIVNQSFAREFFNGESIVSRRIRQAGFAGRPGTNREVVGYVEDSVYQTLRQASVPTVYLPIAQRPQPPPSVNISVRAAQGSPRLLTSGVVRALGSVDSDRATHAAAAVGTGRELRRAGATRRDPLGLLRRSGLAARGSGALRSDLASREPSPYRDRRPHGARRRTRQRCPDDPATRRRVDCCWRRHRYRGQSLGVAIRGSTALRARAERSDDACDGCGDPRRDRRIRGVAPGAPSGAHRSCERVTRRVTSGSQVAGLP
jgi:MacB-like periplasmic core domain